MAASAVFGTVELLEFILEECRVSDLVNAYKVNKTFRETIDDSVKLRRPLFRSAKGNEAAIYKTGDLHYGGNDPGHWEHISFKLPPPAEKLRPVRPPGSRPSKIDGIIELKSKPIFLLNPFLRRFLRTRHKAYLYGEPAKCLVFTPTNQHFSFKQCKLAGNSWKDLLLTQPPTMSTTLTAPCKRALDLKAKVNQSSKVKGITTGDLATTMARHVDLCDICDYDQELAWDMFQGNTFESHGLTDTYKYREVVGALDEHREDVDAPDENDFL